mmetsp:Transcript_71033/g.219613  ORF Transcript_71033/g.219613 Transcript_71033/m.219613 type:complete len:225 (-) Transcript_71033:460-1134(-)
MQDDDHARGHGLYERLRDGGEALGDQTGHPPMNHLRRDVDEVAVRPRAEPVGAVRHTPEGLLDPNGAAPDEERKRQGTGVEVHLVNGVVLGVRAPKAVQAEGPILVDALADQGGRAAQEDAGEHEGNADGGEAVGSALAMPGPAPLPEENEGAHREGHDQQGQPVQSSVPSAEDDPAGHGGDRHVRVAQSLHDDGLRACDVGVGVQSPCELEEQGGQAEAPQQA